MELNVIDEENGIIVENVLLDSCKNECSKEVGVLNLTGSM